MVQTLTSLLPTRRACLTALGLLLLLLLLPGCADGPRLDSDAGVGVELTILHVNDLHAGLLPDSRGEGGFAYVATVLERERAAATSHLTLHAGDMVQGTPVSTLFEGVPIFEIANLLQLDVHCLGNHEFDYGWRKIPEFVEVAAFDTVSANLTDWRAEDRGRWRDHRAASRRSPDVQPRAVASGTARGNSETCRGSGGSRRRHGRRPRPPERR